MAIILRGDKGTALTHNELDNNFRSFFYSASVSGTTLSFFTSASLNNEYRLPLTAPSGKDYYVQFKAGNAPSGANALFSGSENYLYDYRQQHLKHTGSFTNVGNATIDGDLTVTGTVTAQEMRTEFNNSSVVFESGSTKFGDTIDDQHSFTGSLEIEGSFTGSDGRIDDWGSISGSLASNLKFSSDASASLAADIVANSASLAADITANSASAAATYLLNTTDTFAGDLTVTGRINAVEINTTYVSSSILYNSGSNIFGDAASDVHIFTGSIVTEQSITGSDVRINQWGSVSASLASINTAIGTLSTDYNDLQNIPNGIVSSSAQIEALGITSDYTELTNIPSGIISASVLSAPSQGTVRLTTNGVSGGNKDLGLQTTDSPTFVDLTLNGFTSVSSSLAALTAGTITINNDANNRVLTANGDSTLNGESNLTFDGDILIINGTSIRDFTASDTDVAGLVGGTAAGSLIEGDAEGHVVIGIRDNSTTDSFAIISGDGDYYAYGDAYDKLAFQVMADGRTTVGHNLTVSGSIYATNDIIAYHSSDKRLKDNIELISKPIEKVKQINGVSFDWNDKSEHTGHDIGVIAQEIEAVLPELVRTRDDGYKAVRYEKIVALLIEAVKEQQLQIDELKSKL
jgi:hypothetical protein